MEMPKPTEHHARMARLAGSWVGEDRIFPTPWDPQGGSAASRMDARMALGGFHLVLDWQQTRHGQVNFEGHGVLGWDARGRCYTLHWFDSMGVEHGAPAFGSWEGDRLTLTHETTHMGHSRQVYEVGDDAITFRLESSPDGAEWSPFMESNLRRAS